MLLKSKKKLLFERKKGNQTKWGMDITGPKKILSDAVRPNSSLIGAGAQFNQAVLTKVYKNFYKRFIGMLKPETELLYGSVLELLEKNTDFKKLTLQLLKATDIGTINDIKIVTEPIPENLLQYIPDELKKDFETKKTASLIHEFSGTSFEMPLHSESAGTLRIMTLALPSFS